MSGEYREVPSDLITHNPKEHNAPIEATASGEVPLENMDHTPGTSTGAPSPSIYTPNKTGLTAAAIATPAAITGQKVVGAGNWIMDRFGKPSLQTYANSQIGDKNLNIPVKDLQKLTGLPVPVTNPALVQRASKIISGREATPDTFKEIYTIDPVTGKQTLSHIEKTPGISAIDPLDPSKLKPYEKNAKYYVKKHGELPLRTGVAAYDIGKGLSEENKLVGGAEVGAGVAMGVAPWLPKSVKGIPVRAIATGLGLLPGASEAIGSANAEPLDIPGMAIDYGMGLMAPSTLGEATVHPKNKAYYPGMTGILHGTTLPPEHHAAGGLAGGSQPELGEARTYEPSYSEKIRDFAAQHIGREHANRLFGGANARVEDNFNPIAMALQTPGAIADAATGFVKSGQEGDYLGGMGNYLMGAMNVAPMIKPGAQVAKTAIRELGPKAADMAENYLARIGGVQYAVPPSKSNGVIKASEALGKHEDKYLGLTQTDNMGIHDGRQGGNRFPTLQQTSAVHKKDKPVWAMDSEKHAERLIDSAQDPNLIFSTYIGRPDQLKSNKTVFNDVMQQHYNRNLTPEQIDLVNNRIATVKDAKGRLIFPQAFDIRDKFAAQELGGDTFARRGKMSDIIGLGEGVGKTRGGIALPQYEDILRSHRDPLTEGVPTSSIGTQLFKVDPNRPTFKTDKYHTDYQYPVFGENTGNTFSPFPHSMLDWHEAQLKKTNQVPHGNAWFNYMQTPQHINEKFLTRLQKEGFAPGGRVLSALGKSLGEAQAAYKAKFTPGFYHGSPSNKIKAFDTQAERNPNFLTALEEESNDLAPRGFVSLTKNPKFSNDYATGKNATVYPVSANLGKHLDPRLPENYDVLHQYRKNNPESFPNYYGAPHTLPKSYREAEWSVMEDPGFLEHLKSKGYNSMTMVENGQPNVGIFNPADIRGKFAEFNPEHAADPDFMKAGGGPVEHFQVGGLAKLASKFARHPHGQDARVAQALEEYLKGNISQEERIRIMNQFLPMRQWNELPPNYTDDQIRNALTSDKQPKALASVPAGMRVGNRLDIPAYTRQGVYVDTTHDAAGKPISYGRTGHLKDVEFSSSPDKFVRVGLGTQPQALTPLGAEIGLEKTPKALIKGIHQGTPDDEVRRMMTEMMQDPNYTQIGMDPRKHSQFYDKSTGMPVWSAEEKLQSGPLIIAPKKGLETTSWDDPRLNLSDFEGKKYAGGGSIMPDVNLSAQSMPNMIGKPGVGYMNTPQGAILRMQLEQELANKARLRAGATGMGMALPGQQGVTMMPGSIEAGLNIPVGQGNIDISGHRSINPVNMPTQRGGHMQGANVRYTLPFKKGGKVKKK